MPTDLTLRQYIVLKATEGLLKQYDPGKLDDLHAFTVGLLHIPPNRAAEITVIAAPSLDWRLHVVEYAETPPGPDELVIVYQFDTVDTLRWFRHLVDNQLEKPLDQDGNTILGVGADPGGLRADHWCPGNALRPLFGHRRDAWRTISANVLVSKGLRGDRVNVVVIDQGLDSTAIPAANWGGGLSHGATAPGTTRPLPLEPETHGMMVVRNILDLAPCARIYDLPLIPQEISDVLLFAHDAHSAYVVLLLWIAFLQALPTPRWKGPWVLVNAWAIFDRTSEQPFLGDYTENPRHPFNRKVAQAVAKGPHDVVFAAGNCGQFCPSGHCGDQDRGPGHSIWGANSLAAVLTAGAVRVDELWLGTPRRDRANRVLA